MSMEVVQEDGRGPHSSGMKNSHSQNNSTELGTVFPFYLGSFGVQRLVEHNNNALETQGPGIR